MKRGAIYARISDPSDTRVASIDSQVTSTRTKLESLGCTDIEIFIERYSGALFHERKELSRLRDGIRTHRYDLVGVHVLDRFSRDIIHLCVLFDEAEQHGVDIVSATETIDATPEGKLMLAVRGYTAQVERQRILERTTRGTKRLLADNKLICAGWARFGYIYDVASRTRVIEPTAAAIIQRMFELAAGGASLRQIAATFNQEHVPTSSELLGMGRGRNGWGVATIRAMLIDPSYAGAPQLWKGQPLGGPTPPLVTRELWEQAGRTICRHRSFSGTMSDLKRFRLLAGMITCGCGHTMTTQKVANRKRTQNYTYYVCMGRRERKNQCQEPRIQLPVLEQIVWEKTLGLIRDPAQLRRAIEQARGSEDQAQVELDRQRQVLAETEGQIERLIDRLGDNMSLSVQRPLQKKLAVLTRECDNTRVRIGELESRLAEQGQAALGLRELLKSCQAGLSSLILTVTATDHVPGLPGGPVTQVVFSHGERAEVAPAVKRRVLLALGARVVVRDREVTVSLDLPLVRPALPSDGGSRTHQTSYRLRVAV